MPRYDNMFGGGNYDSDDLDEWLTIQRDWQVDAGIEPLGEEDALAVRARAARAVQAVFDVLGFPAITDEEVRLAATCLDSRDLPDRDRAADVVAGDRVLTERISGLDVARALTSRGFEDVAEAVFGMQRQKVAADYLQTSAIIDADGTVVSAVNEPNEYSGPGHGLSPGGRALGAPAEPAALDRRAPARLGAGSRALVEETGEAVRGTSADEVVIAVGPAVGTHCRRRSTACSIATCSTRSSKACETRAQSRGWCASAARPTSHSSATTARGSRARASRSGCSRRAQR